MSYLIGNTVQLSVQFYDKSDGVTPIDVTNVVFKVYDFNRVQIGNSIVIGPEYKVGAGNYIYNYTIPNNSPYIDVEWSALSNGLADVSRDRLQVQWAENDTNSYPTPLIELEVNSYITLEDAQGYFDLKLGCSAWEQASSTDRMKALIQATRNIDRLRFKGSKVLIEQKLAFPRIEFTRCTCNFLLTDEDIPFAIQEATCEEALSILENVTTPNTRRKLQAQGVKSISFGHASETYISSSLQGVLMNPEVLLILKPFLANTVPIRRRRY